MNILYCGDENIADGVILSALSLAENVSEILNIFILTANVQTESKTCRALPGSFEQKLTRVMREYGAANTVTLFDISDLFANELPVANMGTRFTPCCMLRLYADLVPRLPDRILYLDNDVLCRADISEFYHQKMGEWEMAGTLDYYGRWFFRRNLFKMDYLNSGVLLLNLARIRQSGLFARCRERCRDKEMFMPDQSALNKLCERKKILPRRYNEQRILRSDTVFQHFTTSFRFFPWFRTVSVKPWNIDGMHNTLKLHEYDTLLERFVQIKNEYFQEDENYEQAV